MCYIVEMENIRAGKESPQPFLIFLIKPTHYDDDGYPIIWRRTFIPSNSLAVLNALCTDFKKRQVLGAQAEIHIEVIDEAHTRVAPAQIIKRIRQSKGRGFVGLVGVQTNQFPRAMDLAHQFAAGNIPVCVGGFHVAGYLSTMSELPPEVIAAQQAGISFFTGESEQGRLDEVLVDAFTQQLKPLYNWLGDLPEIANEPLPFLPATEILNSYGEYAPFDLGRGCPFHCTFCTIINVHGQKSRFRSADDLEQIVRSNCANGVRQFFLTDDNIARNKNWESFFERLHALRKEGLRFRILAQVDTSCHRIAGFIPKAVAAGIDQLLIGLESMNADNLVHIQKRQNKIEAYKQNLSEWKRFPVVITASYIIGLPCDTVESVRRDVELIKSELPVDVVYFTNLTPLPGSVLHREIKESGAWLDDDYNRYDTHHFVVNHQTMTRAQWQQASKIAWETFYTPEHMETVLKRMVACGSNKKMTTVYRLAINSCFGKYGTIHPIDAGIWRKRNRMDRRPGFPIEPVISFYWKHFSDVLQTTIRFALAVRRLYNSWKKLKKDPQTASYSDRAISDIPKHRRLAANQIPDTSNAKSVIQKS